MTFITFFSQKRALGQCMWYEKAKEVAKEVGIVNEVDVVIEVEDHYQGRHREIAARSG